MDSELSTLSELLSRFDKELVCKRTGDGVVRVYHNKSVMRPYDIEGETYYFPVNEPYHVFSLTDTWGFNGRPIKYGTLPLREKLKSLEDSERQMKEILQTEASVSLREQNAQSSMAEDMAYNMRDAVKRDTNDVLTHSLNKNLDKRRIYENKRG